MPGKSKKGKEVALGAMAAFAALTAQGEMNGFNSMARGGLDKKKASTIEQSARTQEFIGSITLEPRDKRTGA